MRSAHDQMRAREIRATHRRRDKVCAGCGQTWPCTLIAWADDIPLTTTTLRGRRIRATALIVAIVLVIPVAVSYLPTWALGLLLVGIPVASLALLIAASGRRL